MLKFKLSKKMKSNKHINKTDVTLYKNKYTAKMTEYNNLQSEYSKSGDIAKLDEMNKILDDMAKIKGIINKVENVDFSNISKTDEITSFCNAIRGNFANVSLETAEDGSFLIPQSITGAINDLKRNYISLKTYCTVSPVSFKSGADIYNDTNEFMATLAAGNQMQKSLGMNLKEVKFDIKDHTLYTYINRDLIADNSYIIPAVERTFAKDDVLTENFEILKAIHENKKTELITAKKAVMIDSIKQAVASAEVLNPVGAVIVVMSLTNYKAAISLKDNNGRALLVKNPVTNRMEIDGAEVIAIPDIMFKLDKTNDYSSEIYVGNFKEAVDIKERAGLEIRSSEHVAFLTNMIAVAGNHRFDVTVPDSEMITAIKADLTEATA